MKRYKVYIKTDSYEKVFTVTSYNVVNAISEVLLKYPEYTLTHVFKAKEYKG